MKYKNRAKIHRSIRKITPNVQKCIKFTEPSQKCTKLHETCQNVQSGLNICTTLFELHTKTGPLYIKAHETCQIHLTAPNIAKIYTKHSKMNQTMSNVQNA